MGAYYNENNPEMAAWLKALIAVGSLVDGDVDQRSITEVQKDDLKGYTQCHFFAGIGGWPLALRLAGWPDERPVWTGSCPCGPYSIIGKRQAQADARDLWPAWFSLMDEGVPDIFGEQVADAIELGWYDRLADDVDTIKKSSWAVVLPSCSTGQGNKGERLFFVVKANSPGLEGHPRNERQIIEGALQARHIATPSLCHFVEGWDGLNRPIEPGLPMLVDGLSGFMARVCAEGFGNAINPQLAAEFIFAAEGGRL